MASPTGIESSPPLRVAIVLDSLSVPAWVAGAVAEIEELTALQSVVVLPDRDGSTNLPRLFKRYLDWDANRASCEPDPLAPVDLAGPLKNIPQATLESLEPNLDLLLWFSQSDPNAFPPVPARHGLWFFHHGMAGHASGAAAYFPELLGHHPVTSSYLLALPGPGRPVVRIAEAHAASEIGWSLRRQRIAPFWKAAALPGAGLRSLQSNFKRPEGISPRHAPPQAAEPVTNKSVLRFTARNLARTVDRRLRYSNKEAHWFVAYRTNREQFVAQTGRFTADGFQTLPAPPGHFYADPFVFAWQNRTFLFVEDYLYAEARGVLSVLELLPDGQFSPAREILNCPYHLSYPFVFQHEGEVYLIPETMASRRIELYRAVEMPLRWELVKVLQEDLEAVDTTLWVEDGIFYFFTNLVRPGMTPNDLLYLFTADSLTGDWRPHPDNPVSYDVRAARGAGKLFRMGDKLVRPAQDCSIRYGYGTQLNHVEVLTPRHFREKPLFRIEPDWAPRLIGTHTINSNDAVEAIDGQIYQAKYRNQPEES